MTHSSNALDRHPLTLTEESYIGIVINEVVERNIEIC